MPRKRWQRTTAKRLHLGLDDAVYASIEQALQHGQRLLETTQRGRHTPALPLTTMVGKAGYTLHTLMRLGLRLGGITALWGLALAGCTLLRGRALDSDALLSHLVTHKLYLAVVGLLICVEIRRIAVRLHDKDL